MNSQALYVYAPTTFDTDATIELYQDSGVMKGSETSRQVTLQPGIYRLTSPKPTRAVSLRATGSTSYEVGKMGTKSDPPDVPRLAQEQFRKSPADLNEFLGPSGDETVLPPPPAGEDNVP